MKYQAILDKADSFNAVLMTQNGFPVYDIMVPSTPGYCRASGLAFYTEDEEVLKKFNDYDTKQRKQFLLENPDYIQNVEKILKNAPEMNHPMPLAYNHLVYNFEQTVKNGNYGSAHLLENDKLLIFHQSQVFHKTGFKISEHKDFNELYDSMQTMLYKAYKEGKITPDGSVSGKALQRLKAKNPAMFKEMTPYQEQTLEILKSFKNELLESCKLSYDKGDSLVINMQINQKNYVIDIPQNDKELLTLTINEAPCKFKNIHNVVVDIYKDYSENKLNTFIKKIKI